MPQPASSYCREYRSQYGPDTIAKQPELAALVAKVIGATSFMQSRIAICFTYLLGSSADVGIAMYTLLISTNGQNEAIRAAARHKLSIDDCYLLSSILTLADSVIKDRNRLAHDNWGYAAEFPDALLLLPAKTHWKELAVHAKNTPGGLGLLPEAIDADPMVYMRADFEEIMARAEKRITYATQFHSMLTTEHRIGARIREQLLLEPEIYQELTRQRKNHKMS